MSTYLSRLFAGTPEPTAPLDHPSLAAEVEAELEQTERATSQARHSASSANVPAQAEGDSQSNFTVMTISNLLAQNSTLLAQNLEMSRQIERLRPRDGTDGGISLAMERIREELRSELKDEMDRMVSKAVGEIVGTLGQLQPTPRPTPSAAASASPVHGGNDGPHEFSDMVMSQMESVDLQASQSQPRDRQGEDEGSNGRFWNLNQQAQTSSASRAKGKGKEIAPHAQEQERGVDPNALRIERAPPIPSFSTLDASSEVGGDDAGGWDMDTSDADELDRSGGMDNAQLSAIARQVLEMENTQQSGTSASTSTSVSQRTRDEGSTKSPAPVPDPAADPTTPTQGPSSQRRGLRQSASQPDYRSHPIDTILTRTGREKRSVSKKDSPNNGNEKGTPKTPKTGSGGKGKGRGRPSTKSTSASGKKRSRASMNAGGDEEEKPKPRRQRTYNGKTSMNARPLAPSNGISRGGGVWPPKGENTVKGNMQEIACDVCNGRVHWACAGFEDGTIPPDEWQCPDCIVKVAQGVHPALIEKAHAQDTCMRPTCIRKEKKKIIVKEGDEEEFYVEKYIGRRAIGRKADEMTRVFEYLVKWLGYSYDVSTWEHENKFPANNHFADDFLQECHHHGVPTKKRVALLPEARRWFDANGNAIDSEAEEEDDGDDIDHGAGGRVETVVQQETEANAVVPTAEDDEKTDEVEAGAEGDGDDEDRRLGRYVEDDSGDE